MIQAHFDGSFDGWRNIARDLLISDIEPSDVVWRSAADDQGWLLNAEMTAPYPLHIGPDASVPRRVPRQYFELARAAACYRDPERWSLLYRILWRLTHGEPLLLRMIVDPDVHQLIKMDRSVHRDVHKMKAFVRFRRVDTNPGAGSDCERYIAWFAPQHDITLRVAPFFIRRFTSMSWSILTPDVSISWDRDILTVSDGVPRSAAPSSDELEALWRTYYSNIFNPARVKIAAMRSEMPKKYWANLPEAALIPELIASAPQRVRAMIRND